MLGSKKSDLLGFMEAGVFLTLVRVKAYSKEWAFLIRKIKIAGKSLRFARKNGNWADNS